MKLNIITGLEKIDEISQLLADISWTVGDMLENGALDKDYKNLDEVITYLKTVNCVLPQRSLGFYLERIM